jgi:extracellular elastinolytic metalloproteinase
MSTPSSRRRVAAFSVAALAAAGFTALAPSATGQGNPHAVDAVTRVHWAHGKALGARSPQGADAAVRGYLSAHGLGKATADSLRAESQWTTRGVTLLRLQQYAAGLRVVGSDVKAALKDGRPVSVIENASAVSKPTAARISADDAKRAAIDSIYHGRAVDMLQAPSVERVAVPMSNAGLAEGYVVTTWDADNQLRETLVDGSGAVVHSQLRTAEDGYNVFAEDPDKSAQTLVSDPADPGASPLGWLSSTTQYVDSITGNNAHAYLDTDANNKPDKGGAVDGDGVFDKVFDPTTQPSAGDNKAVAVQNLFYLNNLIHDTLYNAGFTPAAGNFQSDNLGLGGRDGDPVLAEAQDGSGTDNANFATPNDGRSGRMQMYLWSVPGTSEVVQDSSSYDAPVAEFSAPLTATGVTGPLVVANDGVGTTTDACEAVAAVPAGSVVIADRGTCAFTVKAANIKAAGAAGVIVANNAPGSPFVMGGTLRRFGLPAVMVSQDAGVALKALATPVTLRLVTPAPPMKDGDLDTDIVWHEYGHGLTWRMIGNMDGPMSGAIGEGMSDVLSVIVNDDPIVGEYSFSDPAGIRSHSYEGYETYRTYGDVAGTEVHFDGEVYGAIGWDLWKQYRDAGLGRSAILSDLVMGMNFTPAGPNFQEMRDGILDGMVASNNADRACLVWNSFAKYGVGVNATSTVSASGVVVTEDFSKPAGCP